MSTCEQCGAEFTCAMADGKDGAPCWCTTLPKLELEAMPANASSSGLQTCLCPACLQAWTERQAGPAR